MKTFITNSADETKKIAKKIAQEFKGGIIALSGELGSGKTTFAQGFAEWLDVKDKIISPTFVLVRQHKIPKSNATLFHIDLYRLETFESIKSLGIDDFSDNPKNIVLIEWAEKAKELLPKNTTKIVIENIDTNSRRIIVT